MQNLKEIEDLLRHGRELAEKNLSQIRHETWQRVLHAQRQRRKRYTGFPPWVWALASLILIVLCFIVMLLIKY
jgi:uncharacterized membrane protein YidH (DUF202 family)